MDGRVLHEKIFHISPAWKDDIWLQLRSCTQMCLKTSYLLIESSHNESLVNTLFNMLIYGQKQGGILGVFQGLLRGPCIASWPLSAQITSEGTLYLEKYPVVGNCSVRLFWFVSSETGFRALKRLITLNRKCWMQTCQNLHFPHCICREEIYRHSDGWPRWNRQSASSPKTRSGASCLGPCPGGDFYRTRVRSLFTLVTN